MAWVADAERGWHAAKVEDIATASGVSAATAYNHFRTKHSLIGSAYAPVLNWLIEAAAARSRAETRP
ncbi:helix-turn-helix domain-containing protein [Actinomadura macra]|uniref:helix-turn-helix domain-containing protein n=1 Tax=Actinomadura macra TaxID=46164 RepID=UPI0009FBF30F